MSTRYAYNPQGNGRWMSLNLKKRRKLGKRKGKKDETVTIDEDVLDEDFDMDVENVSTVCFSCKLTLQDGGCRSECYS